MIGNPVNQSIVAVYGKNNCILLKITKELINRLHGRNAELLNVAESGIYIHT